MDGNSLQEVNVVEQMRKSSIEASDEVLQQTLSMFWLCTSHPFQACSKKIDYLEKFELKNNTALRDILTNTTPTVKCPKLGEVHPCKHFYPTEVCLTRKTQVLKFFKNSAITSISVVVKGTISSESK